jgi:alanyl-tRNA synthetase
MRRIADHVRAGTFLVADGVKPSNEGRGYVARRVLRRAVRDGIALGITKPFLHRLVPVVVGGMGEAYPELRTAEAAAVAFVEAEEERFRETFETGIALLERELDQLEGKVLPGETAFVLYDSHGFPVELCEEILAERGLRVDRAGFEHCMDAQRARSREGSTMGGEVFVETALTGLKKSVPETCFVGYASETGESEASAVIRGEEAVEAIEVDDGEVELLAAESPFYAEAGGQIGDTGLIEGPEGRFRVTDTRRVEDYIVHIGRVEEGRIRRGDRLRLEVDAGRRASIRRNHSATHLLHAALRTILGTHVTQAGSLVAPDRLRFDFTHPQGVRQDELAAIESWVNEEILANHEVVTRKMELEKARAAGAMALFGEKYADVVRVVQMGEHSIELCGGTHVGGTAEIGACLLTHEGSVASGVRRVEMVTGGGALSLAQEQRRTLRELSDSLKTSTDGLSQRIQALHTEIRALRQRESEQKKSRGLASVDDLVTEARQVGGIHVVVGAVDGDDAAELRTISDAVRKRLTECALLLAGRGEEGIALLATATDGAVAAGIKAGDLLRGLAEALGGKGGGRPQMAQGRAPSVEGLDAALAASREAALGTLSSR